MLDSSVIKKITEFNFLNLSKLRLKFYNSHFIKTINLIFLIIYLLFNNLNFSLNYKKVLLKLKKNYKYLKLHLINNEFFKKFYSFLVINDFLKHFKLWKRNMVFKYRYLYRLVVRSRLRIEYNLKYFKHNVLSGSLHVTFKKRNTFFLLRDYKNKTLYLTTVRKEGYLGRRRKEYVSIFTVAKQIKPLIYKYKLNKISLLFSGWSRFKWAVKKALRYRDGYRPSLNYVKFLVKVPHNGCRSPKLRRKKRSRRRFFKFNFNNRYKNYIQQFV
jgi:ribosomal protein S11